MRSIFTGGMSNLFDCNPDVNEFELQSRYNVNFEKGITPLYPLAMD